MGSSSKDYYAILGIPKDASEEAIKKAFRKIAVENHPDKPNKNAVNQNIFQEAKEAYETLNDPLKREKYNESQQKTSPLPNQTRVRHGTDVRVVLKVRSNDVVNETSKNIMTPRWTHCPACAGTGSTLQKMILCPTCRGSGIDVVSSVIGPKKFCLQCKGYGNVPASPPCKKCSGSGLVQTTITQVIKLSRDHLDMVIPGSGNFPQGPGIPGNLVVVLEVEKESLFEFVGKNLKGKISISPAQAVLGDNNIFLDVFDNPVKVVIPPGTCDGQRVEKDNVSIGKGNKKGTLFLTVKIEIPTKISAEEKDLYTKLLKIQKGFL